jgi:hypothetical protein
MVKEDLRQIAKHHTDETELQMIDQLRAYYLISGTILQLGQEDSASGMSQIRFGGITKIYRPSAGFSQARGYGSIWHYGNS